ncbi:MAG: endonuclease [Bacteroidales bacterium]|nr:endonuclease [Bacteroidales bacterium]
MNNLRKLGAAALLFASGFAAQAAEPDGYYSSCENKGGKDLLSALCSKIGPHTTVSYDGLWNVYKTSDVRSDGTLWDMYSTKRWSTNFTKCGNYQSVGDCVNREHSMPKSWFNEGSPMKSDAFHVYPTDGKVNGQRSNYPYGECANGTTLPGSGSVKALGRLGASTTPGYSGRVFEPDDEYKGDFARTYFYMAACYNTKIGGWTSDMFAGNSYPVYKQWAIDVLLKWHRQDPVSDKERDRNDAVYKHQKNRNPFIDHPEMAEYIWGDRKTERWTLAGSNDPVLTLPVSGSTVDLGTTVAGVARTAAVKVAGSNLDSDVTLSVSGAGFTVSPATIAKATAGSAAGGSATVTFTPATEGSYTAVLTVASGSLRSTVNLRGTAISTLPAAQASAVGAESFTAKWSYIGDADASGCYTLDVKCGGSSIAGYPRSVNAAAESFTVEGLIPETQYIYTVSSMHLVSDPVTVTTTAPMPAVTFLYDDDPVLYANPGEPSAAAELLVEVEFIDVAINVSVSAPFQISTDKSSWSTALTLDPEEDRMYLRVLSDNLGTYRTSIVARAGDYFNDDAEFEAIVAAPGSNFLEDFEKVGSNDGTYNNHTYEGKTVNWDFTDAGKWAADAAHGGTYAVRMGKTSTSCIAMAEDHPYGLGKVTMWVKRYNQDSEAQFELEYSTDGGRTWATAGTGRVTDTSYKQLTFTVNAAGNARMRVRQTSGARFNIDDIEATTYASGIDDAVADYHTWDAYARDGRIVVETMQPASVSIYALDGTILYRAEIAGTAEIEVATGLYIVAVDDYARRVLVK